MLTGSRGKCTIRLIKDIRTLRECDVQSLTDIFFSLVSFDPNNSRLASVQGEIRVGGSYQVCSVSFLVIPSQVLRGAIK